MEESVGGDFTIFEHRATGVAYLILGFLGICLNMVTLLIFWCQTPLSGNKNRLHIHLAFTNIMIVLCTPFSGLSALNGKWLFGDFGCKIYGMESYTGGMGAITFATFLCVERYFATACRQSYNAMSSTTMTLVVLLGWMISIAIALGPFMGWNSYVVEASGTACGLDWRDNDKSFFKALIWYNSILAIIAVVTVWAAFSHDEPTPTAETSKKDDEWFSEKSLNWIAIVNFAIVCIGFSPYGFFAVWTVFSPGQTMTMLASIVPPLAAKASTIFYPIAYLVASKRFRKAYAAMTIGTSPEKKVQ